MTTYLDTYVYQSATQEGVENTPDLANPEAFNPSVVAGHSDTITWFREQVISCAHLMKDRPSWMEEEIEEVAGFRCMIAPFVFEDQKRPLAASLDRDLVTDFRGQDSDGPIRDVGLEVIKEYGVAYLDLPHRAYMIGEDIQMRGLLVVEAIGGYLFTAILTKAGSNVGRRVTWAEGRWTKGLPGLKTDNLLWSADVDFLQSAGDLTDFLSAVDDRGHVFGDIEHFAWLAMTYVHTEQENGMEWERLPHIPQGDPRRSGRKARQVAKKFSLFSVIQVNGRNLYRDDADGCHGGGTPGHKKRKHRVRGHFRLQAYGPRWSKRRLRWIPAHDSGTKDIPPPIPLYKVRGHHLEEVAA